MIMDIPENKTIQVAFLKTEQILSQYNKIMVSVSGGSDSDIMLDMIEKCKKEHNEIHYVFFDTGIEYEATKNHLKYLEEKYNISIERIKPKKSIPVCVKKYGAPFLSKEISNNIHALQLKNFDFTCDIDLEDLCYKYPKTGCALKWWKNAKARQGNINYRSWLKEFLMVVPPTIKISAYCCHSVKKVPSQKYIKENNIELKIMGIRKVEKGIRSMSYKNCFSPPSKTNVSNYRPLFYFSDADKEEYKSYYNIRYSDCYEKYGMTRTGCAGCPFAIDFEKNLKILEQYEPKLFKAVNNIFKSSYEYQRQYYEFTTKMKKLYNSYAQYLKNKGEIK